MKTSFAIAAVVLVLVGIIAVPIAVLFSVNTLFGTQLELTFLNWLAAAVLVLVFAPLKH